eukprot:8062605-Heterocapsa_arctica.AAC.1
MCLTRPCTLQSLPPLWSLTPGASPHSRPCPSPGQPAGKGQEVGRRPWQASKGGAPAVWIGGGRSSQ